MTGRASRRQRWAAVAVMGFAASATLAQVSLPPAESVATASVKLPPIVVPVVPEPEEPAPMLCVPPLVITAPTPPVVKVAPRPPVVPPTVVREVAPLPSVKATPIQIADVKVEPTPQYLKHPPVYATPEATVPARTASLIKPIVKPALAEIVSVGPVAVDANAAFKTALTDAKAATAKVRDISGHLLVQERIKGELQAEQTAEFRFKASPRSVALRFIAPSAQVGRELIAAEGRNAGRVRVKAAGTFGPLAFANLHATDAKAALTQQSLLQDVVPGAILERIEKALAMEAKLRNPVMVTAADYTFADKTVTRYEVHFERSHGLRDAAKYIVCIDPDTKLPVRFEAHDTSLREAISYVNLTFNSGLGDGPFER